MDQKTEQVWHAYQEKVPDGIGIIAIDGCTAYTGKVNVLVIEDDPLEEK